MGAGGLLGGGPGQGDAGGGREDARARGELAGPGRRVVRRGRPLPAEERGQFAHRVGGGRRPVGEGQRHHAGQRGVQVGRQVGAEVGQRRRAGGRRRPARGQERVLAGEREEQRRGQAEHVGPAVHVPRVAGLLRGHVPDRPQPRPVLRQAVRRGRQAGHPEVQELGRAVGREDDVRRLDVPVDEALAVRLGQGVRDLVGHLAGAGEGQRAFLRDQVVQVAAGQVLHDEVRHRLPVRAGVRLLAGVQVGDDVRVPQGADGPDLQEEPLDAPPVLHPVHVQRLDGGGRAQGDVLGAEDHAHAPAPDLFEDAVVAEDQPVDRPGPHPGRLVDAHQAGGQEGFGQGRQVAGGGQAVAVGRCLGVPGVLRDDARAHEPAEHGRSVLRAGRLAGVERRRRERDRDRHGGHGQARRSRMSRTGRPGSPGERPRLRERRDVQGTAEVRNRVGRPADARQGRGDDR